MLEIQLSLSKIKQAFEDLQKENNQLKKEVKEWKDSYAQDCVDGLHQVDCGIGKIWFKTDNLKLEQIMEGFVSSLAVGSEQNRLKTPMSLFAGGGY